MRIRDARWLLSVAQEDILGRAIKAVLDGIKQVEVAEIFRVTRHAADKWIRVYRQGGGRKECLPL